ncbi:MAG: Uma2 family endonuclease [Nostoc sp. ChiSLP01]|nr:Uma2 family endonuclease [Nostoc sp. CmiSLP01]MDZ8284708.1 Uma2 family endonuclease [Nostoc sp. ChiSLP01]
MSEILADIAIPPQFPDHTQLPESDGTFVKNFQEHPQTIILTDSFAQVLQRLHPDGQYCIGQDCGIYWRETEPPEKGAVAPDWFYVPGVPPRLDGKNRRSYVLWREYIPPLIAIELASGNGDEEQDATPLPLVGSREGVKPGKFWVYERVIRIPYYAIYEISNDKLEVYHLVDFSYHKMQPNERGHYPIPPLGVELGLWQGSYLNNPEQIWLRWWDLEGNLLLLGQEEAELQRQRVQQAEQKAAQLAERLRAMGIDPDLVE